MSDNLNVALLVTGSDARMTMAEIDEAGQEIDRITCRRGSDLTPTSTERVGAHDVGRLGAAGSSRAEFRMNVSSDAT